MSTGTARASHFFPDYRPFLTGQRARVAALVALSLLGAATEAASLVAITLLAVAITDGRSSIEKNVLGGTIQVGMPAAFAATTVLIFGRFVLGWATVQQGNTVAVSAAIEMRQRLLAAYEYATWEKKSSLDRGRLQEIMTSHSNSAIAGVAGLVSLFVAGTTVVVMIVLAAILDFRATVAIAVAGAILLLTLGPIRRATRRAAEDQARVVEEIAAEIHQALRVARETEVFGVNHQLVANFDGLLDRLASASRRVRLLTGVVPISYQSGALLILLFVTGLIYNLASVSLASLAAVVLILIRTLAYNQQVVTAFQAVHSNGPFATEISRTIADLRASAIDDEGLPATSITPVEFSNVSFRYPGGPEALSNVSFSITRGESIGIVGPSGSGKSTLVQLLLGLREPTAGDILVNGVDLSMLNSTEWRTRIAFVPQDSELITATVIDNVRFYRSLSDEAVVDACRLASLDREVDQLPAGYGTLVGPGGHTFSGGQSQRLCLARALAGRPDLLVLDEPTSALDAPTEAAVANALAAMKGDTTLVIIAHRLSTLQFCDRILVLVDGAVQGVGTHEELLETSSFFREAMLSGNGSDFVPIGSE